MLDVVSGLIRVRTVCKGYQQMTLVGNELNIENMIVIFLIIKYMQMSVKVFL